MLINCRSACLHATELAEAILSQNIDIAFITETWLNELYSPCLDMLVPTGFSIINKDRKDQRGGGVAIIHKDNIAIMEIESCKYNTFECLTTNIKTKDNGNVLCHLLYHPPGNTSAFGEHLSDLIAHCALVDANNLILGDLNLRWNETNNPLIQTLSNLLCDNNLTQHCTEETHYKGATLDAIIAQRDAITIKHTLPVDWSDHHMILFHINQQILSQIHVRDPPNGPKTSPRFPW